jgi:FkbM family methyltransferase
MRPTLDRLKSSVRARWGRPVEPPPDLFTPRLLELVYPTGATSGYEQHFVEHMKDRSVNNLSDLRTILSSLERHMAVSPVEVRFGAEDLGEYTLDEMTLYALHDDVVISRALMSEHGFEPHVTRTLERFCQPGMHAIDIGANVGAHSFLLSKLVGSSGHVLAVEPNSENCRLIVLGILRNNIKNLDLLPVALDRELGWNYFATHVGTNGSFQPNTTEAITQARGTIVPTLRLDDIAGDRVDLIKIDVEGAESRVMEGGLTVLKRDRPIVISEFSVVMLGGTSQRSGEEYLALYEDLGYSSHVINRLNGDIEPITTSDLVAEGGPGYEICDLLLLPPGS